MKRVLVIGAGAAGYFAAIHCAQAGAGVRILEASSKALAKVRISGGGRCNVTHNCCEPRELVKHYPRGGQELLGPFHTFGPYELMQWFENQGVALKTEDDGRVFPCSDDSQSIAHCLQQAADEARVRVDFRQALQELELRDDGTFAVHTRENIYEADVLIIATGSSPSIYNSLRKLGHHIIDPVPSLFTLKYNEPSFHKLSGLSVDAVTLELHIADEVIASSGSLLLTHWGMSGPVILKASAWAARALAATQYRCELRVNWLPDISFADIIDVHKRQHGKQKIIKAKIVGIPQRLWQCLVQRSGIAEDLSWAQLPQKLAASLLENVQSCTFAITGKATFKEEFVTAGGISRNEINWQRMESKCCAGLYFAGECIDVDAVTGGFNFQNAWTTGWIAAQACSADDSV